MPLHYEIDNKLNALSRVVDDHGEWFSRMTKRILFPAEYKDKDKLSVPDSFPKWVKEAEGYNFIQEVTLNDLGKLFEELHIAATGIMDKAAADEDPITIVEYENFLSLYESFVSKLRRMEHDCAMSDSGLDIESALRSQRAMEIDINRELERRSRRGNPFTLALARIDNYEEFKGFIGDDQHKKVIGKLGQLIKKCIRSFDDAYRSGDNEFIMSLKHSESSGGTAAVNRLRGFLVDENIVITGEGKEVPLTMSYCVAEPVPGDTLEELLTNMRADLDRWREGGGDTAVEYHEQSPLQRFINEGE